MTSITYLVLFFLGLAVASAIAGIIAQNAGKRIGEQIGQQVAKDILPRSILPTLYVIEAAIKRRKITPEAIIAECIAYWEESISAEEVAEVREKWIGS